MVLKDQTIGMAYGESNGHVTDDVVTTIHIESSISKTAGDAI